MANPLWRVKVDMARLQRDLGRVAGDMRVDAQKAADAHSARFAAKVRATAPRGAGPTHIADTVQVLRGYTALTERVVTIGDASVEYMAPLEFGHVAPDGSFVEGVRWWTPAKKIFNKRWKAELRRIAKRAFKRF